MRPNPSPYAQYIQEINEGNYEYLEWLNSLARQFERTSEDEE